MGQGGEERGQEEEQKGDGVWFKEESNEGGGWGREKIAGRKSK